MKMFRTAMESRSTSRYVLSTISGLCLVSGITVLTSGR